MTGHDSESGSAVNVLGRVVRRMGGDLAIEDNQGEHPL